MAHVSKRHSSGCDDFFFGAISSMSSASISKETSVGNDMAMVLLTIGFHGLAKPDVFGENYRVDRRDLLSAIILW